MNIILIIFLIVTVLFTLYTILRKVFLKKTKMDFYSLSAIGLALTTAGLLFITFFNKILSFLGITSPIDSQPITPEDLKSLAEDVQEKKRKETEDELNKKTPDDIIDNVLPHDTSNDVRSTIDGGKRRIDDLFDTGRMGKSKGEKQTNSGGDS